MKILVTAGNTFALIDKVRCITNIFTGRTGAAIAQEAHARGHAVTLLTSHPETVAEPLSVRAYRTFEDLQSLMMEFVTGGAIDAIVHCAAVSDYLSAGVYSPAEGTRFDAPSATWHGRAPTLIDRTAGKVKSDVPELWLRLVRAPKLVDRIRADWGFRGLLVKFKLEVGVSDEQLLDIAERSRAHSSADLMVANTLEGSAYYAFLGAKAGAYERVYRGKLAVRLLEAMEALHHSRS
jgi:phosphopantothenate-cysteine ligase/phosphopantothenoylcysteine decarboxylase/phosphopantothenate--cysteine ligase